jgi:aminotransferase
VLTVVNPGDEVLVTSPCFSSHIEQITLAGGVPVFVPLLEDEGWKLDIDGFEKAITKKTKAMIITNPSNPVGAVFPKAGQLKLAELAIAHDIIVITDEPYDFLVYDDNEFYSLTNIAELKNQRISCFSLSKEYAMTGFRIGYVYAEEGFVNQMLKVHDAIAVCASGPSQYAGIEALMGPQTCVDEFREEFAKRRDLICSYFDEMPDLFSYQKPQGAYYIFPKVVPRVESYEFCIKLLKEARVVLVPGDAFGPTGKGHVRFSYACSQENISEGMKRIIKWWGENK